MLVVNVATCDIDAVLERGAFRCAASTLGERLGAGVMGATVYEMDAGDKQAPYQYHRGVEEWMYVVSGAPIVRDPSGERTLTPGELVAFAGDPSGAHSVHGPGRIVMFSAGANGWGEAFVTVYPDSDKIAAAPGVMFRRRDALESWDRGIGGTSGGTETSQQSAFGRATPHVNVLSIAVEPVSAGPFPMQAATLGLKLGART
jgi:uncharacterized cupin superfamily protein